jgi:hypothetical protein
MDRLRKLLEEKEIPYEIIQHETPIRSAREGAKFFGIDPGQTAPVLIVQSDTEHYARSSFPGIAAGWIWMSWRKFWAATA